MPDIVIPSNVAPILLLGLDSPYEIFGVIVTLPSTFDLSTAVITVATPSALVDILGVFKALDSSAKPIAVNFLHPYMNLKCLNQLIYHYYYSLHRHSHLGSRYSWLHYPSINNYYHQYLSPNLFRPDQFYLSDFPRKVVLSYTEIFLKQWVLLQEMDSFGIIKPCSEIGIIDLLES